MAQGFIAGSADRCNPHVRNSVATSTTNRLYFKPSCRCQQNTGNNALDRSARFSACEMRKVNSSHSVNADVLWPTSETLC